MGKFLRGNLIFLSVLFVFILFDILLFKSLSNRVILIFNIVLYVQIMLTIHNFIKNISLEEATKEKWKIIISSYMATAIFTLNTYRSNMEGKKIYIINIFVLGCFFIYILIRLYKYFLCIKIYKYYKSVIQDSILLFLPISITLYGFIPLTKLSYSYESSWFIEINRILANFIMLSGILAVLVALIMSFYSKAQKYVNISLLSYMTLKILVYYFLEIHVGFKTDLVYTTINFIDIIFYTFVINLARNERRRYSSKISHIQKGKYNDIFNIIVISNFVVFSILALFVFDVLDNIDNIYRYVLLTCVTLIVFYLRIFMYDRTQKQLISEILLNEKLDSVAKIYSRAEFRDKVESFYKEYTIFVIDLYNFKSLNEIWGRKTCNFLLFHIGEKLGEISRRINVKNIYGVYGGNEFLIAINSSNPEKINNVLKELGLFKGIYLEEISREVDLKFKVGYTTNKGEKRFCKVIEEAIFAKDSINEYEDSFCKEYTRELAVLNERLKVIRRDIKDALNNNELYHVYQPQISINHNKIVGYESLIRWNHSKLGPISANEIIESLKLLGLSKKLDLYVFEDACRVQRILRSEGINIQCSVNMSIDTLKSLGIVSILNKTLKEYGLTAEVITIEILEDFNFEGNQNAINEIIKLKKYGFKISIDDFGKGYSSINRLLKVPFDQIKIPKDFIKDIPNRKYISMLSAISNFAKELEVEIVVEGVESKEYYDFFKLLDFNVIQGFYFSEGLKKNEFLEYVKKI